MPAVAVKQPYALVLREDESPENPREAYGHFGKMVCFHPRYTLGDKHEYKEPEDFLRGLARDTVPAKDICDFAIAEKAKTVELKYSQLDGDWLIAALYHQEWEEVASFQNPITGQEEEIADVLLEYMDTDSLLRLAGYENIILPLYLYDHSGLSISTGSFAGRAPHAEWDSGQVGWIYAGKKEAAAEFGEGALSTCPKTMQALEAEVSEYASYLRGECYGFQLYENGVEVDSCWGFLGSLEAVKAGIESHLPDACKGVMENLVYLNTAREVDDFLLEQERQSVYMEGEPDMNNTEQASPIKVEARAYPFPEPKGRQLAFASVTLGGVFAITGIKIMGGGEKGPFVAMPSAKDREGNYKDICFPTTKALRVQISAAVMDAYNAAIEKGLTDRAARQEAKAPERASAADKLAKAKEKAARAPRPPKAEKAAPAKDAEL